MSTTAYAASGTFLLLLLMLLVELNASSKMLHSIFARSSCTRMWFLKQTQKSNQFFSIMLVLWNHHHNTHEMNVILLIHRTHMEIRPFRSPSGAASCFKRIDPFIFNAFRKASAIYCNYIWCPNAEIAVVIVPNSPMLHSYIYINFCFFFVVLNLLHFVLAAQFVWPQQQILRTYRALINDINKL